MAGVPAKDGKGIGVTVIDSGSIGAAGLAPEACFFEEAYPGVSGCYEVYAGDDAFDGWKDEQGVDDGTKSGQIDLFFTGSIKAIDADGAGFGKVLGGKVHLDGRVYFEEE